MSILVHLLAGWALDHLIGLAEEGLELEQFQPAWAHQYPEYLASRKDTDDHQHEINGSRWFDTPPKEIDPVIARRLLGIF